MSATEVRERTDGGGTAFVRVAGLYQVSELEELLAPGADFRLDTALPSAGTCLVALYRRPHPRGDAGAAPYAARGAESVRPQGAACGAPARSPAHGPDEQHRDVHLCVRCDHAPVCKVAAANDLVLLATINHCRAFRSSAYEPAVVELQPIEPIQHM